MTREFFPSTPLPTYHFRLFVAGQEANSLRARENLKQLCERDLAKRFQVEIVDVLIDYQEALRCKIFITPALLLVSPEPRVTIYGTLGDLPKVRHALRIEV